MRKILRILIITIILNISFVKAADFSTSVSGNTVISSGGTITVTFKANSAIPLYGIKANLNYDSNLLELTSKQADSDFSLTFGSNVVLDRAEVLKDENGNLIKNFAFLVLKFKAKSNFKVGMTTSISLTNITGSDRNKTLTGSTSKLNVKMASSDNNLSNLTIDSKTISGFTSGTISYKMTVENSVSKVVIGATASDKNAKVSGTGTKNLSIYNNIFRVVVTSEAGTTKTYTITIVRKDAQGYAGARSNDSKLKSLNIEGYDLDFNSEVKEYELSVKNEVSSLNIDAIPNDSNAKVEINNSSLEVGLNKIIVKVIAEDESTSEYVINVTRNNENPVITIDKFDEVVANTTKETIEVLVNDDIITIDELKKIKESGKNVIFAHYDDNKLIYAWHLLNSDIDIDKDFNTKVLFESKYSKEINDITNYAEAFYISTPNENNSKVKLKVLTNLNENTNLYYYDEEIYLEKENLEVSDLYVEFPFLNNDYFLSRMEINKNNNKGILIILLAENFLIVAFCVSLIFIKKKKEVVSYEEN